jgi:hypothetical protein
MGDAAEDGREEGKEAGGQDGDEDSPGAWSWHRLMVADEGVLLCKGKKGSWQMPCPDR